MWESQCDPEYLSPICSAASRIWDIQEKFFAAFRGGGGGQGELFARFLK